MGEYYGRKNKLLREIAHETADKIDLDIWEELANRALEERRPVCEIVHHAITHYLRQTA